MTPGLQAFLSGAVGMGAPLALAIWELARTRRNWGNWDGGSASPISKPGGESPARPLPDCLRPVLPSAPEAAPARRLELV